jgi:uncharacterized protein YaaW (UPF0174 family)
LNIETKAQELATQFIKIMKGYGHTFGQERECPEVEAVRESRDEVLALYKHDPEEEKARLKRNAEKAAENMRIEANFWLKVIGSMFAFVAAYTVLFAYFG